MASKKKTEKEEERIHSNIYGWDSEIEVANEIYGGPFEYLLEGMLVFAYKNHSGSGTIKEIIITKTPRGFRYCFLPLGASWTCYNPLCSLEYLEEVILEDFKSNKTDKNIIEDYLECIKYYGKD